MPTERTRRKNQLRVSSYDRVSTWILSLLIVSCVSVGALFIKQSCEMNDTANARKVILRVSFYRKPGQSGTNPQLPTQLTEGQFESSARLEIRRLN